MYAVHEIKAPEKTEKVEKETLSDELSDDAPSTDSTVTETASEEKPAQTEAPVQEKKEEPVKNKVEKPQSDEFDD